MVGDSESERHQESPRAMTGGSKPQEELVPLLYGELRKLASAMLVRTPQRNVLQATEVVHDAYLRLAGPEGEGWSGRGHFFGAAARAMRNVLVDHARRAGAEKRGGGHQRHSLHSQIAIEGGADYDILDLDLALEELERRSPRAAKVVELRYFAGLTIDQAAESLEVSAATVEREWSYARAWLLSHMRKTGEEYS